MVQGDPIRALLGLCFLFLLGFAVVGRIWLFGRMKEHVPGLSLFLSTTFFYLEVRYWRNRDQLNRSGLGIRASLIFVSPLAVLAIFLMMYLTRT